MPRRKKTEEKPKEQFERFAEAARELGCDEDTEAFKDKLKKLVKAPPPETVQKRKAKGKSERSS